MLKMSKIFKMTKSKDKTGKVTTRTAEQARG